MQLVYVIVFVDDMSAGVSFYRETLKLPLRFSSRARATSELAGVPRGDCAARLSRA
jgi:hypothetical protein